MSCCGGSTLQPMCVGNHEAAPVIEFEKAGESARIHRGVELEVRARVSELLSFTAQQEHGWQRQTMELYDALQPGLCRYVRSLGLAEEATEDAIQDTFLRLAAHLRAGNDAANLKAWVFHVAYNLSMDVHRASRRDHAEPGWTLPDDKELIDPRANPEREVLENERQHRLRSAMSQLTPQQRNSILLRAEGMCYREIASALGVSEQRAMHLVKRGLARLSEGL